MAFQGNLHLLSKGDFFLLETEMLKLRDGRDAALRKVDEELAAETERVNFQRDRRRRNTERDPVRPARPRNGRTTDVPERTPEDPAPSDEAAPPGVADQQPTGNGRDGSNGRARRSHGRGRNRRTPDNPVKYDND